MFAGSFKSAKKYETAGQYTLKNFQGFILISKKFYIFFDLIWFYEGNVWHNLNSLRGKLNCLIIGKYLTVLHFFGRKRTICHIFKGFKR